MIKPVSIKNRMIGNGKPCYIIAEVGVNHNGDIEIAQKLIDEAVKAGVDAVKFQIFRTEALITVDAPKAQYQTKTTTKNESQYQMLKNLELSTNEHAKLKDYCEKKGVDYLCTPYDEITADILDDMNVSAFKIASTDTTNIPFLRYLAKKGRPAILSTGMSNLGEIELAVNTLIEYGLENKIIILHATSEYPAPVNEINLRVIENIERVFLCPSGYSDHTEGIKVSSWAVAMGAHLIEKHFTLDKTMEGPDHSASIEPHEMVELVSDIRTLERAFGNGVKKIVGSESQNKQCMQKSLVACKTIKIGEVITKDFITCKRPGTGLKPLWLDSIVGKKAAKNILKDEILTLSSIIWD